jgi:D-serine deaminase-like pyridoxal phosphate-dependent protein
MTTLDDLPTPALVLDISILKSNLARMAAAVARHPGLVLRPHMKTAKSLDVAALAAPDQGPITVSTLAEARYFLDDGYRDQIYAVGIAPAKLDAVAALNRQGASIKIIVDDAEAAAAIAAHPGPLFALIEVDVGEGRGGITPESPDLLSLAATLGYRLAGVLTHAGHSYAGRSPDDMARIAETERAGVVRAATRLREAGHEVGIVSLGSSPTVLFAKTMEGVTEVRAGVYMFGDLLQMQLGVNGPDGLALTVLGSVIGRKPEKGMVLLDAGAMALSKDRSTEKAPKDYGFGLVLDIDGRPSFGELLVVRTHQEHGEVRRQDGELDFSRLHAGTRLRVAPNHACLTAAAYECYHVVDGGRDVIAVWDRVNGW